MKHLAKIVTAAAVLFSLGAATGCRSSIDIVISRHVDPDNIRRIAIFKMDRLSYRDGDKISDLLTHELLRLGYDVVERTEIEKLIKEQKLGASGFVDPDQAVAIGKMAGADSIVIGSGALEDRNGDVLKYFTVKIIDLKSGSVVITANLVKNQSIKGAVADFSSSLRKSLNDYRGERR